MSSSAQRAFAGVLGWPLDQSLSPALHNAAFNQLGLEWLYFEWPVAPPMLPRAVEGLRLLGAAGANVTIPHKTAAMELMDEVSDEAGAVGALNTIERAGARLVGHNTDVSGFKELLVSDAGFDAAGKSAVVLGSGGAARAVVKALDDLGCRSIMVAARRAESGAAVAQVASGATCKGAPWDEAGGIAAAADLVVNATPAGDPIPDAALGGSQVVVDLNYRPAVTPLMRHARSSGCSAWGGIGMLVNQAAESLRIWTALEPPIALMRAAGLDALRELDEPPGQSPGSA